MTGILCVSALALLLWPDGHVRRRWRLRSVIGSRAGPSHGPAGLRDVPVPAVAAVAGGGATALLSTPLVAALAAVAAFLVCRARSRQQRHRRVEQRLLSLTEGLGALAADLRSGRSLTAATEAAVAACSDAETAAALARALRAPGVGPPAGADGELSAALDRVAAGVLLSGRTGCSLAAVATAVEDDLRARHRLRLELRTATAGPRASAVLLAGLPVLGLLMGSGVGADPWRVLTATGIGQVLLVVGVALELAGLSWSAALLRRALR